MKEFNAQSVDEQLARFIANQAPTIPKEPDIDGKRDRFGKRVRSSGKIFTHGYYLLCPTY